MFLGLCLLEALVVELRGQGSGQKEFKVADGSLHGDVEGTEQRPPFLQHLLGGRLWEIPRQRGGTSSL